MNDPKTPIKVKDSDESDSDMQIDSCTQPKSAKGSIDEVDKLEEKFK